MALPSFAGSMVKPTARVAVVDVNAPLRGEIQGHRDRNEVTEVESGSLRRMNEIMGTIAAQQASQLQREQAREGQTNELMSTIAALRASQLQQEQAKGSHTG
jgi:hypothetical protein